MDHEPCTGKSIFQDVPDPTFVLVTFIWHGNDAGMKALRIARAHRPAGKILLSGTRGRW